MPQPQDPAESIRPELRMPQARDGAAIWELVRACKPLDENSMYCNMIQCDHFAETCILAELDGDCVGWVSAYVMPNDAETLFVWQVAVAEAARGLGLGAEMLRAILERDVCDEVSRIQTTITSDNSASWALFRKFGKAHGATLDSQPYYTRSQHFRNRQKTENLVTIVLAPALARAA